jgi:anti-anti-sigma factor
MADPEPLIPTHPHPAVVTLPGEIDMTNAHQVRQWLYAALATGTAVVVADMTATRFCDTMGLRALVLAHKRAVVNSAELRVAVTSDAVLRVMGITKLDTVLRIYPSTEKALTDGMGCPSRNQLLDEVPATPHGQWVRLVARLGPCP